MHSQSFHNVNKITCDEISRDNANAIELTLHGKDHLDRPYMAEITLFGLPIATAEILENAFFHQKGCVTEAEIRADERRKIIAKLGLEA